jgi:predicted ester cyclase
MLLHSRERKAMKHNFVLAFLLVAAASGCSGQRSEVELNKAIVMKSEAELWSRGNLAVADQLYAPNFIGHFVVGPDWRGIEGIKNEVKAHRVAFPDWQEHVDDIIAEGDRVVIRFTSTGTNLGTFAGNAPTGRKVRIQEVAIYRLEGGKIVEQWGMPDLNGLMTQLKQPN